MRHTHTPHCRRLSIVVRIDTAWYEPNLHLHIHQRWFRASDRITVVAVIRRVILPHTCLHFSILLDERATDKFLLNRHNVVALSSSSSHRIRHKWLPAASVHRQQCHLYYFIEIHVYERRYAKFRRHRRRGPARARSCIRRRLSIYLLPSSSVWHRACIRCEFVCAHFMRVVSIW